MSEMSGRKGSKKCGGRGQLSCLSQTGSHINRLARSRSLPSGTCTCNRNRICNPENTEQEKGTGTAQAQVQGRSRDTGTDCKAAETEMVMVSKASNQTLGIFFFELLFFFGGLAILGWGCGVVCSVGVFAF